MNLYFIKESESQSVSLNALHHVQMRRLGKLPSHISKYIFTCIYNAITSPLIHRSPRSTFQLDFTMISLRLVAVRKLGSYLIILLLITAYGRCMADQFGVLHTTDSSCCQVTCSAETHCEDEAPSDNSHSEESDKPTDKPTDEPAPCQLCFILSSDSILLGDGIAVPSPTVLELNPLIFNSGLDRLLGKGLTLIDLNQPRAAHPDPPEEHRSRLQRIVAKLTPVRGPSIV